MDLFIDLEKGRKSVGRVDGSSTDKKKDKLQHLIDQLGLQNFEKDLITRRVVRKSDKYGVCGACGKKRPWSEDGKYCECGHDHIVHEDEYKAEKLSKADNSHLPDGAERFTYKTPTNYDIIYIPVNRLKQVYQTDKALDPKKVNENMRKMKEGIPLEPIAIGYNYDVHDGHHRWEAAKRLGYTHVPCKVVGTDPDKVKEAKERYREVWKSMSAEERDSLPDSEFGLIQYKDGKKIRRYPLHDEKHVRLAWQMADRGKDMTDAERAKLKRKIKAKAKKMGIDVEDWDSKSLVHVLDLQKAMLNKGKLVKRRVAVRGKNGKVFYRMQWVRPDADAPNIEHPGVDHSTYAHHEEGIKEMERRQSNRFPVLHHDVNKLKFIEHNYRTDKEKYAEAERKFNAGEKLPPVKINPKGEVLDNHHLVDLARNKGLTHVPVIVVGNPVLKKQLEDKLKDEITVKDEETGQHVPASLAGDDSVRDANAGTSSDIAADLQHFNIIKKKYTKQHLMNEARRQGITWNDKKNDGTPLPENSAILWMRAHQAIVDHIKSGKKFEVRHDEKDVDKRMQQDGKDSIHKHFLKLLEKHGSKDALMEWARKNGIKWKEKEDPSINWMYAVKAIKDELAKGRMLDGVRTRQKAAMEEANTVVTDQIKSMVTALGKKYGKSQVMKRAEQLGIQFDRFTKKGEQLPENSNILWMRAHEAIAKYIAKGNEFKMGDEQDTGIVSTVGDYGEAKITKNQAIALDRAKRNSQNKEPKMKKWALDALMVDRGISREQAEELYKQFMEKARNAKIMIHFDPFEKLPNGVNLIDQLSSDGVFKNDYELNRGFEPEHREINERDLFGDEYDDTPHKERPNYGVIDLYNLGLASNKLGGDVAFVLKDDVKKRATGSAIDSNSIPYGEEGQWVRSLEDPHHLIIDRWRSRWKNVNRKDAQRIRAMDAVLQGKPNKDDNRYFEAHIHGGVNFARDVDHILVPQSWKSDKAHKEKHEAIKNFAKQFGLQIKYEGSEPTGGGGLTAEDISKDVKKDEVKKGVEKDDSHELTGVPKNVMETLHAIKNKDNYPLKTFHATPIANLESIREKGLIPGFQRPPGQDWLGEYSGKGIYMHSSFPHHELDNADLDFIDELDGHHKEEMAEAMPAVIHLKMNMSPRSYESRTKLIPEEENPLHDQVHNSFSGLAAYLDGGPVVWKGRIPPENIEAISVPDHPEIRKKIQKMNLGNIPVHYVNPKY
jgi:hypothetical protein